MAIAPSQMIYILLESVHFSIAFTGKFSFEQRKLECRLPFSLVVVYIVNGVKIFTKVVIFQWHMNNRG